MAIKFHFLSHTCMPQELLSYIIENSLKLSWLMDEHASISWEQKKIGFIFVKHVFICKNLSHSHSSALIYDSKLLLNNDDIAMKVQRNFPIINHQSIDLILGITSMLSNFSFVIYSKSLEYDSSTLIII